MVRRVAIVLVCTLGAFAASEPATVADVIAEVRNGLRAHESDGAIARILHKSKITERLDEQVLEELESAGAGPKVMEELERLRYLSEPLAPPLTPPVFPHDATPPIPEQRRIVNAAQETAIHYSRSLPDFMCVETIRRYEDPRGTLQLKDTIEVKLSYFDRREHYSVLTVNGRMANRSLEEIGGTISEGEFGSMLASVFSEGTIFRWDHWTTLRKRVAHVYTFRIPAEHAKFLLQYSVGPRAEKHGKVVPQHGFVYIDRETNQILRIYADADLPADFPVRSASTLLDYDFVAIGGRSFLLPLRADVRMATEYVHTRNLVAFQDYRKFAGESTITFQ